MFFAKQIIFKLKGEWERAKHLLVEHTETFCTFAKLHVLYHAATYYVSSLFECNVKKSIPARSVYSFMTLVWEPNFYILYVA